MSWNVRAHHPYRRSGFIDAGTISKMMYIGGEYLDVIGMYRELKDPNI